MGLFGGGATQLAGPGAGMVAAPGGGYQPAGGVPAPAGSGSGLNWMAGLNTAAGFANQRGASNATRGADTGLFNPMYPQATGRSGGLGSTALASPDDYVRQLAGLLVLMSALPGMRGQQPASMGSFAPGTLVGSYFGR